MIDCYKVGILKLMEKLYLFLQSCENLVCQLIVKLKKNQPEINYLFPGALSWRIKNQLFF